MVFFYVDTTAIAACHPNGIRAHKVFMDDRKPVPKLVKKLFGILCGDKGYASKTLFSKLYAGGVKLVTGLKCNMKNCLMSLR